MSKDSLQVQNICKSVPGRQILNNVSFSLEKGEVVAILGPNGAGKTTSFYAVIGLSDADSGKVIVDSVDVSTWPVYKRARQGISYLAQENSIFRGMTVEENIKSVLQVYEKDSSILASKLDDLIDDFGLHKIRKYSALALSGGERRRVEIARCVATNPSYVLLDEPFAGVDPIAINDIRILVKSLIKRNIGVLITDHNVQETLKIVDRAYILYNGEVIKEGTPEEIVADEEVRCVYLGADFKLM
ncbi:MAG TPA: LPS export ABC transporter ATP-binding protein [Alphaproteobacteria bacterium]|nr:LPS export ABC transporter ATP-binding protein [Alphaproteobacteria bacterium]